MTQVVADLLAESPLRVTCPTGRVELMVLSDPNAPPPLSFGLRATVSADKVAVRIAGGCKGLDPDVREELLEYHVAGMAGYGGTLFSGGTRDVREGRVDAMVTEVAVAVGRANPGTVILGSMPRTKGNFGLVGDSEFVVGEYDTRLHPGYDAIIIVQDGVEGELTWHGDLPFYFKLFESWIRHAGYRACGLISSNGGAATEQEIIASAKGGYPTILVHGFERVTDQYAEAYQRGELDWLPKQHKLVVAERRDPSSLRDALLDAQLLVPA